MPQSATHSSQRHQIDLPAGTVRYREAGEGKPVVFVHGYLVDGRLWDGVVDRLSDRLLRRAERPVGNQNFGQSLPEDPGPRGRAPPVNRSRA